MLDKLNAMETTLRIPGTWPGLDGLRACLPVGYRITQQHLEMPDGTQIECALLPADKQFAGVFRGALRRPATQDEMQTIDYYRFNVCLMGPGGSLDAARTMLNAGAAIIRAGAGGVFIDNSGLAHGGSGWLEMAEDSGSDAASFAFVGIFRGRMKVWTMGMRVLGLPDLVMPRADADADQEAIIETLRSMAACDQAAGGIPIAAGHVLADERGPRYQVQAASPDSFPSDSPMHNPRGRLKLISYHSLARQN